MPAGVRAPGRFSPSCRTKKSSFCLVEMIADVFFFLLSANTKGSHVQQGDLF